MKAGRLAYGSDMVEEKIKYKEVSLLIIATDASDNTKRKFMKLAEQNDLNIYFFSTIDELSSKVGKKNKAVFGVMERNFAEKMNRLFEELKGASC